MKCPHCNVGIHEALHRAFVCGSSGINWYTLHQYCSECAEPIILLQKCLEVHGGDREVSRYIAHPASASCRPVPPEVTDPYKQDFVEACAVLALSPKASAALSRRNMQALLREKAATKTKDLHDQIEEVTAGGKMPSYVAEGLHAVRNIGNFAAHPMKSKSTGEIVEVEAGEAEWNLDVLESLFDLFFVQPAITAKRKEELNKKLKGAGKPLIP